MSIRFAFGRATGHAVVARVLTPPRPGMPANDRGSPPVDDLLVRRALLHFAEHGLAAAARARDNARTAQRAGQLSAFREWWEICRLLDRRMADSIAPQPQWRR